MQSAKVCLISGPIPDFVLTPSTAVLMGGCCQKRSASPGEEGPEEPGTPLTPGVPAPNWGESVEGARQRYAAAGRKTYSDDWDGVPSAAVVVGANHNDLGGGVGTIAQWE